MKDSVVLDSLGGAVPFDSAFYVDRPADEQFEKAIHANESIVLLKGPRQVGKTSLIGRGLSVVDWLGWRRVATDFQGFAGRQIEQESVFYRVLATSLCLELGTEFAPSDYWNDDLGPNLSMKRFLRALVASSDQPLVWFIDEADRLFTSPISSDFFGLIRSCHNARATDLRGPWSRLTIVLSYATEAHLFIDNLNQSPFNVGRRIALDMFTLGNTLDLNERYGRPIASDADVRRLHELVAGQPYLTRCAFEGLVREGMSVPELFASADREDGPFGEHLKRVLVAVMQLPFVWDALRATLTSANLPDSRGLQRLVAAGVLVHRPPHTFTLANSLYRTFLARYLGDETKATSAAATIEKPRGAEEDPSALFDGPGLIAELVRLRKKRKLGQSAVAESIGISQARLSQIEHLVGGVPLDTIINYARAIGAHVNLTSEEGER